jgi:hypothetical protein
MVDYPLEKMLVSIFSSRDRLFLKTVTIFSKSNASGAGTEGPPEERFVEKEVFLSLVDKVVVGDGLRFILRDGTEWTV